MCDNGNLADLPLYHPLKLVLKRMLRIKSGLGEHDGHEGRAGAAMAEARQKNQRQRYSVATAESKIKANWSRVRAAQMLHNRF